jgi:tripartite-type tricarboxylate transporter receptor subunit TctC
MGLRLNLVIFPSLAAVRQATLAKNISVALLPLGEAIASLREGRIEGIGLAAEQPAAAFPQLPPLQASGLPLIAYILRGLASPVGLPAAQTERLAKTLQDVAEDPEFHAHADAHGFEVISLDSSTWTTRTDKERTSLVQLWNRTPWREPND